MTNLKTTITAAVLCASAFSFAGPGLADGAAKFVGNITTRGQVRSDFGTYWNQITAENECKWQSIEGSRGNYNFSGCDACYNWAKNNGGYFKFHALVWGSQYPNWLGNLSADDTKKAITDWFDRVKKQYPDLDMIDVVNEAIRTGNNQYHSGYNNTKIIQALGGDNNGDYTFVTTAFKMARERWPEAVLIYNDYNTVQWQKNEGIQLIQTIKKNGAPVDAYGLQAHDMMTQGGGAGGTGGGGGCLNINTLKSVLDEIWEKTQTPMFISEYDIGTEDDNTQKKCYQEQISLFMENEHVAGITLWGYIYGATWVTNGNSGIIKDGRDRAAMTWLKEYLASNKGVNTTGLLNGAEYVPPPPPPDPTPYKGVAAVLPGKIEAENYDEGGSRSAYSDDDSANQGDASVRADEGVDLVAGGSGVALGYTATDEWLVYTVNVATAGEYTVTANVSSGATSSGFKLQIDGQDAGIEVAVPQTGEDWSVYQVVDAGKVTLTAGPHVVKVVITGSNCNIDYLEFSNGTTTTPGDPLGIASKPQLDETNTLQHYYVFDTQGVRMGVISGYGFKATAELLRSSSAVKSSGMYYLRNRATGKMQAVKVVR